MDKALDKRIRQLNYRNVKSTRLGFSSLTFAKEEKNDDNSNNRDNFKLIFTVCCLFGLSVLCCYPCMDQTDGFALAKGPTLETSALNFFTIAKIPYYSVVKSAFSYLTLLLWSVCLLLSGQSATDH